MLGKDFFVFWQIAQGILKGLPLYSIPESLYPPATLFFFAPLGLLPFQIAFALWTGLNVILVIQAAKQFNEKKSYMWFFYTPTIFTLLTGQIDILFLWLASLMLIKNRKVNIACAILITLKPQIAFIVLPWILFNWIKRDRKAFLLWIAGCAILHSFPLLVDPLVYQKWFDSMRMYSSQRLLLSPGLFTLTNFSIPVWLISIPAIFLIIYGLLSNYKISKSAHLLALPMGIWYDSILLVGCAPWKLLVPISWILFTTAVFFESNVPFLFLPVTAFVYQQFIFSKQKKTQTNL